MKRQQVALINPISVRTQPSSKRIQKPGKKIIPSRKSRPVIERSSRNKKDKAK